MSDLEQPQARGKAIKKAVIEAGLRLVDRIKLRKVTTLKLNPRNSRAHSPEQIASIVASIKKFGFTMPLLVDGDGMLIAGHGRLMAAKQLGMAKVPTIDGSYMTDAERRAYTIADNQIALAATWDMDMLVPELSALSMEGFDLDALGFDEPQLGKLLGDLGQAAGPGDEEDAPAPRGRDRAQNVVVQYTIVFDDDGQQQKWFGLLRRLKLAHPEIETIGGRLATFIDEHP